MSALAGLFRPVEPSAESATVYNNQLYHALQIRLWLDHTVLIGCCWAGQDANRLTSTAYPISC